jgi:UDP-N-acetylmuramyl pentapeptide phosphotransferase/UDP-N-acetylglucosamine-1-phosphate transferase
VKFDLSLNDLRIEYFNLLLNYKIFSFIFFIFCILIVTNGTNFIDGLNGLVIGYYTIVIVTLFNLGLLDQIENTRLVIFNYLILFISLFLFNIFNKLYLGDSGSYFVGFVFGAILILVYKEFSYFSPFFIVLLLWYPCFENLFSIIRKYKFNLSPLRADNKHLHHLLFYFMKKKFNLSAIFANNSASILINLVNLIFIAAGANFIHNSLVQIILILALIIFYCLSYLVLFNFRYKKNN